MALFSCNFFYLFSNLLSKFHLRQESTRVRTRPATQPRREGEEKQKMHRGGRLLGRQAAAGSGHRTHLLGPLAPTATAATRAVILPETVDSRGAARGYAKGKGRGMPEQPKKECTSFRSCVLDHVFLK